MVKDPLIAACMSEWSRTSSRSVKKPLSANLYSIYLLSSSCWTPLHDRKTNPLAEQHSPPIKISTARTEAATAIWIKNPLSKFKTKNWWENVLRCSRADRCSWGWRLLKSLKRSEILVGKGGWETWDLKRLWGGVIRFDVVVDMIDDEELKDEGKAETRVAK